jgi:glycosyltransferase involved in cell wall biosynthesis
MNALNISYIIPAYNCAKTIVESVDSIFNGNLRSGDEVIIVDDHSTDQTRAVLKKLKIKYPIIKIKHHKHNRGGGATRNTAVRISKNKLIFCLDSDNVLSKNSVIKLREKFKQTKAEVVSFAHLKYFTHRINNTSHTWEFKYDSYNKQNYLTTNIVPGASGNYLFTKESWVRAGGYPEFAGALDTWGFGLRQVMSGSTMVIIPNTFYFHRIGTESYWVRESKKHSITELAAKILLPYADLLSVSDYYRIYWKANREWFLNLDKSPIILRNSNTWRTGIINIVNRTIFKKI